MCNKSVKVSDAAKKPNHGESLEDEVRHAPKKMTPWEQLVFGLKLFTVAGLVLLLLWLADKAV